MLRTIHMGTWVRQRHARYLATYSSRFNRTNQSHPASPHRIENYYQVLNIPVGSSDQEVKRAFIELSKKYHPDANRETRDSEIFMKICEAYQTLNRLHSRHDSRLGMQKQSTTSPDTATTGRRMCTVWSQYQTAMRNKQMGRGLKGFRNGKPIIFKNPEASQWLPMRYFPATSLGRSSKAAYAGVEDEEEHKEKDTEYSLSLYAYITGIFAVSGLVLMDAITRFRDQPSPVDDIEPSDSL
ncbi:hypothetical protein KR009_001667 [Drosophila setifemur]|nr:hypothetical protein KR009_001667 [Drosophila setifemur]